MPDLKRPLSRGWLILPLLPWGLLAVALRSAVPAPSGAQLRFLGHWMPWSWLVPPVALGLLGTLALLLGPFPSRRRSGFWTSLGASLLCIGLIAVGLSGQGLAFPEGSHYERAEAPPDAASLIRVDLGQGLCLAYSPWVPVDRSECSLPHRVTPPALPLDGEDVSGPLGDQALANLATFTRAFGHLRWFHPTDAACQTEWDRLAIAAMAPMASARNVPELQERLRTFFAAFAPRAQFLAAGEAPTPMPIPEGTVRFRRWVHEGGYGLSRDIHPHRGPVRATRLAAVVVTWNLLRHFSPYLEPVQQAWEDALEPGLREAAAAPDPAAFLHTFRTFTARFRDGHIWPTLTAGESRAFSLPFRVAQAEGRAFVVQVAPGADARLAPGCEILSVDGEEAGARLRRIASEVAPTTPGHPERGAEVMFPGVASAHPVPVRWRTPQGALVEAELAASKRSVPARSPHMPVRELEPGLWYVDLASPIPDEAGALARLAQARSLVVDLRGNAASPVLPEKLLSHLIDTPIYGPPVTVPVLRTPERSVLAWKACRREVLVPQSPRFKAKVAFLIDGEIISATENLLSMVEAYRLGELVGEPTTGTNGNAAEVDLPGGLGMGWTGLRVLRHDGSPFHRVGIRPTVPVHRTVKGLVEGRDEALEAAVQILRRP